ncbi:MAG: HK97 family phage prohead protease [Bacteroidales bacterium]|nr:HK97 family phage prohead protease [Bacteroidales bacterium]
MENKFAKKMFAVKEPEVLQLREVRDDEGNVTERTVSGYAIRFNEDSVKMFGFLTERIAPSCVTEDVIRESDIKMTLFHNRESLLARSTNGKGSLRLSVDEQGLKFEFEPADDAWGRFCVEHIERGDLSGCSFSFFPKDFIEEVHGDDDIHITHTEFERLVELTIGTDPAYPSTTVECREFAEGRKAERARAKEEARIENEKAQREALRMRLRLAELGENSEMYNF